MSVPNTGGTSDGTAVGIPGVTSVNDSCCDYCSQGKDQGDARSGFLRCQM